MVHLHRQPPAGLDVQFLDLEPRSDCQSFKVTPRTVVSQVLFLFLAVRMAQTLHNLADVLRA